MAAISPSAEPERPAVTTFRLLSGGSPLRVVRDPDDPGPDSTPRPARDDDDPPPPPKGGGGPDSAADTEAQLNAAVRSVVATRDLDALSYVLQHNQRRLAGIACRLGPPGLHEDVLQEGFCKMLGALGTFDQSFCTSPHASFVAWTGKIVANTAKRAWKRGSMTSLPSLEDIEAPEPVDYETANPARAASDRELVGRLEAAVAERDETDRAIYVQRFLLRRGWSEIGKQLGLPDGTLRCRAHRLRQDLRVVISDDQKAA